MSEPETREPETKEPGIQLNLSRAQAQDLADSLNRVAVLSPLGGSLAGLWNVLNRAIHAAPPAAPVQAPAHYSMSEPDPKHPGAFQGFHACRKPWEHGDKVLAPLYFNRAIMAGEPICPGCVHALSEMAYQHWTFKNHPPAPEVAATAAVPKKRSAKKKKR